MHSQSQKTETIDLAFSRKYNQEHSRAYWQKHRTSLARRLSHRREEQMLRKALDLAGQPNSVLDLPCGAGRFWPLLCEKPNRLIIAADNSPDMLKVAWETAPESLKTNIKCLQTSAFAIDLPECAVDCIFCVRLLHHVGRAEDRAVMLREFHRVTRDTVILSLWVDGNYKAWRRRMLERKRERRGDRGPQNRFVIPRSQIESEFRTAGFKILGHFDFFPFYQMWRFYVLRRT